MNISCNSDPAQGTFRLRLTVIIYPYSDFLRLQPKVLGWLAKASWLNIISPALVFLNYWGNSSFGYGTAHRSLESTPVGVHRIPTRWMILSKLVEKRMSAGHRICPQLLFWLKRKNRKDSKSEMKEETL